MAFLKDFCPEDAYSVTPSDSTKQAGYGLMVTVAGNVAVTTAKGNVVTLPALQPGVQYAMKFNLVMSTNTTATGIIAFRDQ